MDRTPDSRHEAVNLHDLCWDGNALDGEFLVVELVDEPNVPGNPFLVVVSDLGTTRVVLVASWGVFVRLHRDRVFVCRDSARLYERIERELRGSSLKGRELWAGVVQNCRLHDILLWHDLFCLYQNGQVPRNTTLGQLETIYLTVPETMACVEPSSPEEPRAPVAASELITQGIVTAKAIAAIYQTLRPLALEVAQNADVPAEIVNRFGPLSLGIQVQGLIACRHASGRGMRVPRLEVALIKDACNNEFARNCKTLFNDPKSKIAFLWEGDLIKMHVKGFLQSSKPKLQAWLTERVATFPGPFNLPIDPPSGPSIYN